MFMLYSPLIRSIVIFCYLYDWKLWSSLFCCCCSCFALCLEHKILILLFYFLLLKLNLKGLENHLLLNMLLFACQKLFSTMLVSESSHVTDASLGLPNLSSCCLTCGASSMKDCDGESLMHITFFSWNV